MNLIDYCQNLESDKSLKQVLDFLQDGYALSTMNFTNKLEVEDCFNTYNELDKKFGSDATANDQYVFSLEREMTEDFTKTLTISQVREILIRTERL